MSLSDLFNTPASRFVGVSGFDYTGVRNLNGSRSRRQVVTLSTGRHDPVAQQSIIAQQVIMSLPPQCGLANPDPDDLMAPVGHNIGAMIPKRGEWAVKIDNQCNESFISAPYGVARINDIQVYTCGNGVDRRAKIIFMGIVTNAQDISDPNRDNVGALDVSGTVTGINFGTDVLCAGDQVYIGLPHLIESNSNDVKTMVPGVCAAGMPSDKACFGTYRMRFNTVSAAVDDAICHLDNVYVSNPTQAFASAGNMKMVLELQRGVREEMPLYQFARLHAHVIRCKDVVKTGAVADKVEALNQFLDYMKAVQLDNKREEDTYNKTLGIDTIHRQHLIHDVARAVATASDFSAKFCELLCHVDEFKRNALTLQHNFLRQRMMGRVMVNSAPGQQLDVMMGYFCT